MSRLFNQLFIPVIAGKKAPPAWTPASALESVTPIVWLKADSLTGSDADPIAAWNSTAPATINVAQATAGKKPLYKTNVLNGLPAVLFDTTDDNLSGACDLSAYDKVTIFALADTDATITDRMVLELGTLYNTVGGFNVSKGSTKHAVGLVGGVELSSCKSTTAFGTTPVVLTFTMDRSLASSEVVSWVNGAQGTLTRTYDQNHSGNFGNLTLNVGSRNNGGGLPLTGHIFEIIIYPGIILSDASRLIVETYIYNKWNVLAPGVSDYVDNAYTAVSNRVGGGTFINTSPGARLVYLTDAETAYLDTYNYVYGTYPTMTDVGVRVNGVDKVAAEPGAAQSVNITVDLGAGAGKTVEFINGLQSGASAAARVGSFVCGVTFNKPATKVTPASTPRLIVYGDSIAVGGNADNPSLEGWAQLVRNAYTGSLLIEARGYRSLYEDCVDANARAAFVTFLATLNPSILWLAMGTNDYGLQKWSSADFGTAYADLLDKLHTALPSLVIYAQTPIDRTSEAELTAGWGTLGDYRSAIATAVSTRTAYCTLVAGEDWTITLGDGVHPTTAGHAQYAAEVITVLGL